MSLTLNGIPLKSLGLHLSEIGGWRGLVQRSWPTVALPRWPGQHRTGEPPTLSPRVIPLRLLARPRGTVATLAARQALLDELAHLFRDRVEIATAEDPTRVCYGVLETLGLRAGGPPLIATNPAVDVDAQLVCADPWWYDREPLITALPATGVRASVALGTAYSRQWMVRIMGGATGPITLILRGLDGAERQRMTLTTNLTSNDALEVDGGLVRPENPDGRFRLRKIASGTPSEAITVLGATETFLRLDPPGPVTLELSVGSGTVSGVVYHRRAWET